MSRSHLARWFLWSLTLGLGVIAVAFVWVVWKAMRATRPAAGPLWTEASLPAPPPRKDNGFALLVDQYNTLGKLEVPSALTGIATPTAGGTEDATWTAMQAPAVASFLDSEDAKDRFAGFERSLELPRFADDCPLEIATECPVRLILVMHRTMEFRVVRAAAQGDWTLALGWAGRLARADTDYVVTARGVIAHALGLAALHRSVELSAVLARRLEADGICSKRTAGQTAALESLRTGLAAIDPARIDLHKAVISEYVVERKQLLKVFAESKGLREKLLLDPEDTLRRLDARYKQIAAFAAAPLSAPPPPVSPGTLPWTELVSNPIGKQTLMMLEADVSTVFQNFERKRLEMAKRREGVVMSIGACLEK